MSQQKITKLTPEQEALIPVYREKWKAIALSTERIDSEKSTTEAVDSAYIAIGLYLPHILFFDSPYEGLGKLEQRLVSQSKKGLYTLLYKQWESRCKNSEMRYKLNTLNRLMSLGEELQKQLDNKLYAQLKHQLEDRLQNQLQNLLDKSSQLYRQMELDLYGWDFLRTLEMVNSRDVQVFPEYSPLEQLFQDTIQPELWACTGSLYDFCISVLNCHHDEKKWQAFQLLVKNCGWLLGFEKICIVCDRPTKLSLDNENRLHAEGEPAIQFADGYTLYSYHGVTLPEKYGKLHPNQWQSKWLLEETNAELRRVLIQGIGYSRICHELQAIELDSWQEYTLLKIDSVIDIETIYLLKMTCPSTGYIHGLRVPPNINSARDAIRWVNWGIDPEEFSVQT